MRHKNRPKPSCLVLDLRMKGMGSRELKRRLDGSGESLPTIFISSHEEDLAAARAEDKDAVDYLDKPFQEDVFLKTIYSTLGIPDNRSCSTTGPECPQYPVGYPG